MPGIVGEAFSENPPGVRKDLMHSGLDGDDKTGAREAGRYPQDASVIAARHGQSSPLNCGTPNPAMAVSSCNINARPAFKQPCKGSFRSGW